MSDQPSPKPQAPHSPPKVTNGPMRSSVLGPIPGTRWSESSESNRPRLSRSPMIRSASTAPMPGSSEISAAPARLRSTLTAGNPAAIQTEFDVQILNTNIVDHLIEATLEES